MPGWVYRTGSYAAKRNCGQRHVALQARLSIFQLRIVVAIDENDWKKFNSFGALAAMEYQKV